MARPRRGNAEQTRTQDFLDDAADMGKDRTDNYAMYAEFYNGDHRTQLTDRAQQFLERQVEGLRFHENFIEPIVDVMSERLNVARFTTSIAGAEGDATENEDANAYMNDIVWAGNRMDAAQNVVHANALIYGDAFVIVDQPADAHARITYNNPNNIRPVYSDENPDELELVSKVWHEIVDGKDARRLNIYYPDRIERYYQVTSGKGGWNNYTQDGAGTIPWTTSDDQPLGIPVFHFANKPLGHEFGRSEIHSTIPQQLLLNKLIIDFSLTMDSLGWPQRWTIGIDPKNATFKNVIEDIWVIPQEGASVGQFAAAEPGGMIEGIESTISRISRRSRTPLHLLTGGDMPSGEALKSAESGLVAKVKDRSTTWGNVWEDVQRMALKLGGIEVGDDTAIGTEWTDPVSRNEFEEAKTAGLKHELGVSKETLLSELGYDAALELARSAEEDEATATSAARAMDAGVFGRGAGELVIPDDEDGEE